MNWNHIKADWKQIKGQVKSQWGKLTDDDMTLIEGKWDQLVAKLQERYGYQKDKAEREVDMYLRKLDAQNQNQAQQQRHDGQPHR
ncbi:MAG TPA: CsbD family protein [Polyangiaceae bacterium]|jgi:uncharacterized protein YjbJ (UPF0337 family)